MSLLVDPDWTIHQVRLAYLRRVDDSYGPRIISFPSIGKSEPIQSSLSKTISEASLVDAALYASSGTTTSRATAANAFAAPIHLAPDSHIAIAGLHDPVKHPELTSVYSPTIAPTPNGPTLRGTSSFTLSPPASRSDRLRGSQSTRTLGKFAGNEGGSSSTSPQTRDAVEAARKRRSRTTTGLKYTHTIYGPGRSGALGMRVSGKRVEDLGSSSLTGSWKRRDSRGSTLGRDGRLAEALEEEPLEVVDEDSAVFGGYSIGKAGPLGSINQEGVTGRYPDPPGGESDSSFGGPSTVKGNGRTLFPPPSPIRSTPHSEQHLARSGSLDKASGQARTATFATLRGRSASVDLSSDPNTTTSSSQAVPQTPTKVSTGANARAGQLATITTSSSPGTQNATKGLTAPIKPLTTDPSESEFSSSLSSFGSSLLDVGAHHGDRHGKIPEEIEEIESTDGDTKDDSSIHHTPVAPRLATFPQSNDLDDMKSRDDLRERKQDLPLTPQSGSKGGLFDATVSVSSQSSTTASSVNSRLAGSTTEKVGSGTAVSESLGRLSLGSSSEGTHAFAYTSDATPEVTNTSGSSQKIPRMAPQGSRIVASPQTRDSLKAPLSEEALLTARSKLRKPSRSHLKSLTLAEQAMDKERQQSAWFQSHSLGQRQVAQRYSQPKSSALSIMLQKQSNSPDNPFAQFYSGISGRNSGPGSGSITLDVYFPWSRGPGGSSVSGGSGNPSGAVSVNAMTRSFTLNVRKDATMEELIGYSLYCYIEEGWLPSPEDHGHPDVRLTTVGWVLRIVEDGEVDDDYPALDRNLTVGKFGGDEFAVCEASAAQIRQQEASQGLIQRRASRLADSSLPLPQVSTMMGDSHHGPSHTVGAGIQSAMAPSAAGPVSRLGGANAPAGSLISVQGTPIIASSALSRSAMSPSSKIFLRIQITPNAGLSYKTTLEVPSSEIYLADVLELICRKRGLRNADEWALIVPDRNNIVVPLDRTVESLQGNHNLALVRRSTLGAQGGTAALAGQSTNPNASIFKRLSEPAHPRYSSPKNVTSTYKSWTVARKVPMFVGRHERTLTIDGEWIHIIPTDARAFHAQHASFPIGSVTECKQSTKVTSSFKVVVMTEQESKRYDLEAEDGKQAAEIVMEINKIRRSNKR